MGGPSGSGKLAGPTRSRRPVHDGTTRRRRNGCTARRPQSRDTPEREPPAYVTTIALDPGKPEAKSCPIKRDGVQNPVGGGRPSTEDTTPSALLTVKS